VMRLIPKNEPLCLVFSLTILSLLLSFMLVFSFSFSLLVVVVVVLSISPLGLFVSGVVVPEPGFDLLSGTVSPVFDFREFDELVIGGASCWFDDFTDENISLTDESFSILGERGLIDFSEVSLVSVESCLLLDE